MNEHQLAEVPQQQLATPSIAQILQGALQGGVTKDTVEIAKELLNMQREIRADEAKRDFAAAFTALQAACAPIKASKVVPGNQEGSVRFRYAPYEEIMETVSPLLRDNDFAVTFDTDIADGRVTVTCTLIHTSGHERSNKFACRIGKGPPASSEAQGDGAATTYAKRFALCAALNIVVDTDTDAGAEGAYITSDEASHLRTLCEETGSEEARLLKFAGATSFETIRESRYSEVLDVLKKKQAQAANKPGAERTW